MCSVVLRDENMKYVLAFNASIFSIPAAQVAAISN